LKCATSSVQPSPLVGEGGERASRVRGLYQETPHPASSRCALVSHPLPQGERVEPSKRLARHASSSEFSNSQRSAARLDRRAGCAFFSFVPRQRRGGGAPLGAAHSPASLRRLASCEDAAPCGAPLRLFSDTGPRFLRWHLRHGQPAPGRGAVVRPEWSPGSPEGGMPAARGNRVDAIPIARDDAAGGIRAASPAHSSDLLRSQDAS
jgi:hypothetical protein